MTLSESTSMLNNQKSAPNVKKKVRFTFYDPHKFKINPPVFTNTYQVSREVCAKCGVERIGVNLDSKCKNCSIPKPNKNVAYSKKEFLSRSLENLNQIKANSNREIEVDYEPKIPKLLLQSSLKASQSTGNISVESQTHLELTPMVNPLPTKPRRISNNLFKEEEEERSRSNKHKWHQQLQHEECASKQFLSSNSSHNQFNHNKNKTQSSFKLTCFECKQAFKPGEFAISADNIDKNAKWHQQCFKCCTCNQLLKDLYYYYKEKNIYCQRHYLEAESKISCAACDQKIIETEYVSAENRFWHLEHFVCWECDQSLGGQKYIVIDSKPFCFMCHQRNFAKQCVACKMEIPPDVVRLTFDNLNWHLNPDCFNCYACHKDLLDTHFLIKKNLLFCSVQCKRKVLLPKKKHIVN